MYKATQFITALDGVEIKKIYAQYNKRKKKMKMCGLMHWIY